MFCSREKIIGLIVKQKNEKSAQQKRYSKRYSYFYYGRKMRDNGLMV